MYTTHNFPYPHILIIDITLQLEKVKNAHFLLNNCEYTVNN